MSGLCGNFDHCAVVFCLFSKKLFLASISYKMNEVSSFNRGMKLVLLLTFVASANCIVTEIPILAQQTLIAMSSYLEPCDFIPQEGKCVKNDHQSIGYSQEVVFIVWSEKGEIAEVLSFQNLNGSNILKNATDLVLFVHDFGQSSCSTKVRNLIQSSLRKKPGSILISVDYSPTVSSLLQS